MFLLERLHTSIDPWVKQSVQQKNKEKFIKEEHALPFALLSLLCTV
jgi:hypothetical protein